ncbi:hypothetical protein VNO77_10116 [Canavalia gladiata]|uniref:Uncharacterized protein n=1 Tax=Canavalia gladiata TaxID=3824 RepID=A0AAN9MAK8_CANGL
MVYCKNFLSSPGLGKQFVFAGGMVVSKHCALAGRRMGIGHDTIFCGLRSTFLSNCEFVIDTLTRQEKKQIPSLLLHCIIGFW